MPQSRNTRIRVTHKNSNKFIQELLLKKIKLSELPISYNYYYYKKVRIRTTNIK